ncbi:cytochrome b5-like [Onthophagus taurus]|uniref:cytochrome b5-like n=1 Tax=Onthophagus taurus TaxID=166361 RepID=UPI000C20FABA|nr:cytochrome b5-like [Onthophagus taurus]
MELISEVFEPFQFWNNTIPAGRIPREGGGRKKIFTLKEVASHDDIDDCWVIIYDRVYDLTDFIMEHPGGWEVLIENAGKDATIAFRGTGHSKSAVEMLEKYYIGDLPISERIFRTVNGFKLSDIPE